MTASLKKAGFPASAENRTQRGGEKMLLNICPKEYDEPFVLDHDFTLTTAVSFHAYSQNADTRLKQYIRDHAGKHKKVAVYCFMKKDDSTDEKTRTNAERYGRKCADKITGWEYAGTYIDIGYKYVRKFPERPEFQQMLEDARTGKLDLIYVYNMERFAETIDDTLSITEELRLLPKPVLVMFEKEHTDSDTLHQFLLRYGQPRKRKRRPYIGK